MAAVESSAAIIEGRLGGKVLELMLDSGSSVCLIRQSVPDGVKGIVDIAPKDIRLVTVPVDPDATWAHRAPSSFQRLMDKVCRGLTCTLTF